MKTIAAAAILIVASQAVGWGQASSPTPVPVDTRLAGAVVYTVDEGDPSAPRTVDLARQAGSDVLIRAWFKWHEAPDFGKWKSLPDAAHRSGALFGGGITCSALYDGENGITRDQLLDMATRGPDGTLVDAWGQAGVRHGSLSSPAYLDYLFRWCRQQIDAGVDYLFMDENTAALAANEGFDDHSVDDFRKYLLADCPETTGWTPTDARWKSQYGVPLDDRAVCPSGGMAGFQYRAYLARIGAVADPGGPANKMAGLWSEFRAWRDDHAWKTLTDRIRAYARSQGRTVLISGNGLVKYVDLQVLGIWGDWRVSGGHVDLRGNMIPTWRALVLRGRQEAGRAVPVVLFHDWGFGDPPFPWMAVPPPDRILWMRTRGAEIFASGAFFAFPVEGPFGCDAGKDGTLPVIAGLGAYYHRNADLYLRSRWLGTDAVQCDDPATSCSAAWMASTRTLVVHVVNRDVRGGVLEAQGPVELRLPVAARPVKAVAVSPDFAGTRTIAARRDGASLVVTLPSLDAYTAVLLTFAAEPDLAPLTDPIRNVPTGDWRRPARSRFAVDPDGSVENASDLVSYLQARLHPELRNPPTFTVNAGPKAEVRIHIQGVAQTGADLVVRVDDRTVKSFPLPDRDGKNDGPAPEYDTFLTCPIPPGRHGVTVDNDGADWAFVDAYEFVGLAPGP